MNYTDKISEIKLAMLLSGDKMVPMDIVQNIVDLAGTLGTKCEVLEAVLKEHDIPESEVTFKAKQLRNAQLKQIEAQKNGMSEGMKKFAEILLNALGE